MHGNTQLRENNRARIRIVSEKHYNNQNNVGQFNQGLQNSFDQQIRQSPLKKQKILEVSILDPYGINQAMTYGKNREKRSISDKTPELKQFTISKGQPQFLQICSHKNQQYDFAKGTNKQVQQKFKIQDNQQLPGITQKANNEKQQPVKQKKKEQFSYLIQQQQSEQSRPQTVELQCFNCKIYQNSDFYILPCSHQFHADCLKLLMNNQIDQQLGIIRCKCGKKIPQKACVGLLNPFQLEIYFQIQAQHLPKLNQGQQKWKKCTNHGCDFIFIENPSIHLNGKQSKCPNCIEQILGQTMLFPKI